MTLPSLTLRQRRTLLAHLFKAMVKQHHGELRPLLARYIGPGAVVVDAGAHAGQFTKLFATLVEDGRVYAFEPGSYALFVLDAMMRFRRPANVVVVPVALGDEEGSAVLSVPVKKSGSMGFGLGHLGGGGDGRPVALETVQLTTLDRFAAEAGLQRLDFVKADIEGWEIRLLRGGRAVLARYRPALMLELVTDHLARAGNRGPEAWEILAPLGYAARKLGAAEAPVDGFTGDGDYLFAPRGN